MRLDDVMILTAIAVFLLAFWGGVALLVYNVAT